MIGPKTIGAICSFQKANPGLPTDGCIHPNGATLKKLNTIICINAPHFSDANLYGPTGPSASDIKQDAFGDCYFVATLGAVAHQNPSMIRSAISFDKKNQTFRVRLYDSNGHVQNIQVTQTELQDNILRHGGSYVDNTSKYERTWPAVIETAYAKMFDTNPADGLGQGYQKIIHGGWPSDAMLAITGNTGTTISYQHHILLGTTGSVILLGSKVATALKQKKSITLWAVPEKASLWQKLTGSKPSQDGLVNNHVYTVMSMTRSGSDWKVTVRNPWGTNVGVGEGKDTSSPTLSVSLTTLVTTGGLKAFQVNQ